MLVAGMSPDFRPAPLSFPGERLGWDAINQINKWTHFFKINQICFVLQWNRSFRSGVRCWQAEYSGRLAGAHCLSGWCPLVWLDISSGTVTFWSELPSDLILSVFFEAIEIQERRSFPRAEFLWLNGFSSVFCFAISFWWIFSRDYIFL